MICGMKAIRRTVVLVLILGLCAAPAVWASDGGNLEKRQAFSVSVEQWLQGMFAQVASWFGVTYDDSSTTIDPALDPTLDPICTDPCDPTKGVDGGPGGGGTTDSGGSGDPNGG
jgi:hypothetical protein